MAICFRSAVQNANNWRGSGSGKINALFNLIKKQDTDNLINKIFFVCERLKWNKISVFN